MAVLGEDVRAAIGRVLTGSVRSHDENILRRAVLAQELILATGDRAVAIGGNVTDSVILTGDGAVVNYYNGPDAAKIREVFDDLLRTIEASENEKTLHDNFRTHRE